MALSNVNWKGLKALKVMADILPTRIGGKKLRAAYRYALTPTRDLMRNNLGNPRSKALWYSTDITIGGTQDLQQMYGLVGPRRKKNVWNMQGWGAFFIEQGTKPHVIKSGTGKSMPIYSTKGFTGHYAKEMFHSGSPAKKPFSKAVSSTWNTVADRVVDKVAGIMREEIKSINAQYGQVVTRSGAII